MADKILVDKYLSIILQPKIVKEGKYPNIIQGIKETLYRLPDDIFKNLTETSPIFFFIMPEHIAIRTGYRKEENEPINLKGGFRIVILRSELDKLDMKSIIGIISHELAHAYLHRSNEELPEAESEADKFAAKWGFKEEIIVSRDNNKIKEMEEAWKRI